MIRNQLQDAAIAYEAPEDSIKCPCGFTNTYTGSELVDEDGNKLPYQP
jgi:hypothetical protein